MLRILTNLNNSFALLGHSLVYLVSLKRSSGLHNSVPELSSNLELTHTKQIAGCVLHALTDVQICVCSYGVHENPNLMHNTTSLKRYHDDAVFTQAISKSTCIASYYYQLDYSVKFG